MARLEELFFGYKILHTSQENAATAANLLLKLGICATVSPQGELRLGWTDSRRFLKSGGKELCSSVSHTKGIPGILQTAFGRLGVLIALILSFVLYCLSSELVWDVRIRGNERLTNAEVAEQLRACGFGVGTLWSGVDKNRLESELLAASSDISWISVNRRGSVAYVEIIESEMSALPPSDGTAVYRNIVADRACVIDYISVTSGVAAVKPGDVVRAGDVLISGIVETEQGTTLCRAEGEVRGISQTELEVFVPVSEELAQPYGERLCEVKLQFFNFYINIFKNYGNSNIDCDIIDDVEVYVLFDSYRLPFGITRTYMVQKQTVTVSRTKDEMLSVARARHSRSLNSLVGEGDLLKISSHGDFQDDGYRLTSTVVYSAAVSVEGTPLTDGQ